MPKTSTTFKKGEGRPKGAQGKVTKDIKEAYRLLIEKNLDNMTLWLEQVAKKNPQQALYIIAEFSEYIVPKLSRSELTGKDGEALKQVFVIGGKEIEI
jgi:hypothetical protein